MVDLEIWLLASWLAISGLFGAGGAAEWRRSSALQQLSLFWMSLIIFLSFARAWFGNYSWLVVVGSMFFAFILLLSALKGFRRLKLRRDSKRARKCAHPAGSRCGPILKWMQCYVSAARKVKKKRVLGAHHRGQFLRWHRLSFRCRLEEVDLKGGGAGARVTARKRQENQLLLLANQITSLAEQVKSMQAALSPTSQRAKKKKKPKSASVRPENSAQERPLFEGLSEAFLHWSQAGTVPSEDKIRKQLQQILNGAVANNNKQATPASKPDKPTPRQNQSQQAAERKPEVKTWASLFKSGHDKDKSQHNMRLYGPAWSVPVVSAAAVRNQNLDNDLVVYCQSSQEKDSAKQWLQARGFSKLVTFVEFNAAGNNTVLIHGKNGPIPAKADIDACKEGPRPKSLPESIKDDDDPSALSAKNVLLRLTLAKAFADHHLKSSVAGKPHFLPAISFNEALRKAITQTRGAVDYEREAPCLISVRSDDVPKFLQASLPTGIFLNPHKGSSVPHWFHKKPSQSDSEYYVHVADIQKQAGGRLVYRSSTTAPLGLLDTTETVTDSIAPRWYLTNAPPEWGEDEITNWITQRGFTHATGYRRQGRKSWFFRAHSPADVANANLAFVFKSGISVAPARAVGAKNYSAITQPKTTWGAPELKSKANTIDLDDSDTEQPKDTVAATALDETQSQNMQVDQEANTGKPAEAGSKIQHTPPKPKKESLAKKAKTGNNQSPWAERFTVVQNGGKGDCAYISIAQSLAHSHGTTSKAKRDDFEPRGRLQAQLRVIASQELKKRRAFYIKESDSTLPEDTALAGTWAEATSLYALANASHLDLRIWAWDNLLSQWRFYNISPDNPNKKTPPQIIYLKLQSLHYEFLKPRESIPAEVEAQWLDSAILKPTTLKGGGKRPKLDPEVSSVLRLPLPSNISSGSSHSSKANQSASPLSILGLKQSSFGTSDDRNTKHSILRLKCRKANTVNTIDKFDQVVPDDIPAPEPGDHLKCRCGWKPPKGTRNEQKTKANNHWQKCQGCKPPLQPRQFRLATLAQAGQTAAQKAKKSAETAWEKWSQETADKHPELASSICQPNFDVPFFTPKQGRQFPCKVCGECRGFARMRRFPCKARPKEVTLRQWQTTLFGKFLDPGKPSSQIKSRQTAEWKKKAAEKAFLKRQANGALQGKGRRRDLIKKHAE